MKSGFRLILLKITTILCFFNYYSVGQITITSWSHPPYVTLYASGGVDTSATILSGIHYDNGWSDPKLIGFNFMFYGISYTKCIIGSNGVVGFDTSYNGGYNTWGIDTNFLNEAGGDIRNLIAGPWCDMFVYDGGEITYFTSGISPNRKFIVNFCHVAMFSCNYQYTTSQIILYETTNIVEVYIGHKTICSWNHGRAIVGVKNASGTMATVAPGRDFPSNWNATDEAWCFTPTTPGTSYTVSSIPYSPQFSNIFWYDSSTGTYIGEGDSITVNQTPIHTYIAQGVGCSYNGLLDTSTSGNFNLSTGNILLTSEILISPIPAENELNILSTINLSSVEITNILGKVVFSNRSCNTNNLKIKISDISIGIYFVKINDAIVKKFLKE